MGGVKKSIKDAKSKMRQARRNPTTDEPESQTAASEPIETESQAKMKLKKEKKFEKEFPQPEIIEASQFKHKYFGPDVPTLELECWEEELSEAQLAAYKKSDEEYKSIQTKLDNIVKDTGGEIVYNGDQFTAYQLLGKQPVLKDLEKQSGEIIRSRSRSISKENVSPKKRGRGKNYREASYSPPPTPEEKKGKKKKKDKSRKDEDKDYEDEIVDKNKPKTLAPSNVHSVVTNVRPSENSAVGGLTTGSVTKTPIVDLTKDDGNKNVADSKEVSFNKLQGKTFPSLVVVARPYLRAKEAPQSDRATLDSKVKSVLMHTPTKFTEWLIQQGLLRSEQYCSIHPNQKLKLGMYSDVSKFPYSGGYVWISECCPVRFVSVFNGSIFEGASHPPSVLLKLLYHWACQTNVQNVVQWVKVDNLYVKSFFTWLRAICTAGIDEHLASMGGSGKKVEVGVISLGTTSSDGTQRQVKVEVLGILEQETKSIRLRAIEPLSESEKSYKKRFQKILEPLSLWVDKKSVILTDLTVDKGTLQSMGFKSIHQTSSSEATSKMSNATIMEYLRRIVPRMFQNTLSLLSRQIIQQFLDELVWREKYGITPGQAFDNIVAHVAEQTKYECKDNIVTRVNKIAANPFKNWKYVPLSKTTKKSHREEPAPVVEERSTKRNRKKKQLSPPPPPPPEPETKSNRKDRKKKKPKYVEDDDDEDIPLEKRRKKIKQEKKETKEGKKRKRDNSALFDDIEDIPLKNIKREIKQEEMVSLEKFYFGQSQEPDRLPPESISVQCTVCSEEITENSEVLRHIFTHIVREREGSVCACCLHVAKDDLNVHVDCTHPIETQRGEQYYCIICELQLSSLPALSSHLAKCHMHNELPYVCSICNYRASSKRLLIQHFYTSHDKHHTLQCPHCLMVISIYSEGCDLQGNLQFFMEHLNQHADGKQHKCNRCALKFVHQGMLKEHQVRAHISISDILPICTQDHMIPKPKNKARGPNKEWIGYNMIESLENVTMMLPDGMLCKECGCQLEDDRHFVGVCRCKKCGATSSCWKWLLSHICSPMPTYAGIKLPVTGHCICGFFSDDGTIMLTHLLKCNKSSCYTSQDDATANIKQLEPPSQMPAEDEPPEPSVEESQSTETQNAGYTPSDDPNVSNMNVSLDYGPPPSVLNTTLTLDDLAPPSVMQQDHNEPELLKNEAYEQPLATPRHVDLEPSSLHAYMGDFDGQMAATPQQQTEFEPL